MKFIDKNKDRWHALPGDDGPPVSINALPHLLLDLVQWRAARANWPASVAVGLKLANDQDVEAVADDLPHFALIALYFPKWTDGRAYSQARLLRTRYRYTGEIRATGEVLVDMVPLMARTGFDAVVLRGDQSLDAAHRALGFFPGHYQGDATDNRPLFALPEDAAKARTGAPAFVNEGASI